MKIRLFMLFCLLTICGCDQQSSTQRDDATGSPFASVEETRLWILVRASRVGDGHSCADYFQAPKEPRYQARAKTCKAWAIDFGEYLQLNGVPEANAVVLQSGPYWNWFEKTKQAILLCRSHHVPQDFSKRSEEERQNLRTKRNSCDPYEDLIKNKNETVRSLGIRFTRSETGLWQIGEYPPTNWACSFVSRVACHV